MGDGYYQTMDCSYVYYDIQEKTNETGDTTSQLEIFTKVVEEIANAALNQVQNIENGSVRAAELGFIPKSKLSSR